jgi:hypothetical protein
MLTQGVTLMQANAASGFSSALRLWLRAGLRREEGVRWEAFVRRPEGLLHPVDRDFFEKEGPEKARFCLTKGE